MKLCELLARDIFTILTKIWIKIKFLFKEGRKEGRQMDRWTTSFKNII